MTARRERVMKALSFEETDRVPMDLDGMASTGISCFAYPGLVAALGLPPDRALEWVSASFNSAASEKSCPSLSANSSSGLCRRFGKLIAPRERCATSERSAANPIPARSSTRH